MESEPGDVKEPVRVSPAGSRRRRSLAVGIAIGAAVALVVIFVVRPFGPRGRADESASAPSSAGALAATSAEAASLRPRDPMVLGLDALYKRRDPLLAAARFREVLAQNPEHYGATFQLATALEQAGKSAEAKPVWEKMLAMAEAIHDAPTSDQARAHLAAIARLTAPPAEADPDAEDMRLGLDALYTQHDPPGAAVLFRKVLAHNPEHYGATFQLATALDRAGRPAEARPLWTKVLKMAEAIKDTSAAATARTRLAMNP